MTPYELNTYSRIKTKKMTQEAEHDYTVAYFTAYLQRVEKMKPLNEYLNKQPEKKKVMTDKEMYAKVQMLNAAFGGNVVTESVDN